MKTMRQDVPELSQELQRLCPYLSAEGSEKQIGVLCRDHGEVLRLTLFGRMTRTLVLAPLSTWGTSQPVYLRVHGPLPTLSLVLSFVGGIPLIAREHSEQARRFEDLCYGGRPGYVRPFCSADLQALITVLRLAEQARPVLRVCADSFV